MPIPRPCAPPAGRPAGPSATCTRASPTAPSSGRSRPAATAWLPPAPARGPTAPSSSAACWAWRTRSRWAPPARCTTCARGPSTWIRAAWTRCWAPQRIQENYFKRFAGYPRGITVPAIVDVPTGAVVTNDYPQITLDFSTQWKEFQREGAPDLLPADKLEEMQDGHQAHLHRGQQRGLPLRLCRRPAGLRGGVRPPLGRHGLAGGAPGHPAVPDGGVDHRGRRAAVHHAGALRRRSTTATSRPTGTSSSRCRTSGPTPATCSSCRASATPSTSSRSRSTTTWCTPT